jgi:hypothetical protein
VEKEIIDLNQKRGNRFHNRPSTGFARHETLFPQKTRLSNVSNVWPPAEGPPEALIFPFHCAAAGLIPRHLGRKKLSKFFKDGPLSNRMYGL